MKEDKFGNIIYDGKLVNVDKENIEKLKEIGQKLKERNKKLEEKLDNVFKQSGLSN